MSKRLVLLLICLGWPSMAASDEPKPGEESEQLLSAEAREFLATNCLKCHQPEKPKGKLDLTRFQSLQSMTAEPKRWSRILARVQSGEMPPVGSPALPPEQREQFVSQIKQ